ncbi:hypothetical protein BD626DRAFT_546008 [Schizophyllum amplum]|uniref:Uncharacterized protein n=1 Tax=Schizophyllum amplum TaxID=97359 RepID=A0A550CQB5_9AGAR|nr:hypothetical protein BD626DRAFT_546008 [Auriculariopsis ampla]
MATSDATASSLSSSATTYKGKITRSWPQLPPEVVRLIATHLLLYFARRGRVPHAYRHPQFWQQRMMYDVIRDFNELEKVYDVCPQWGAALDSHLFYAHALAVIDPQNHLAHLGFVRVKSNSSNAATLRVPPARHFRQIYNNVCTVCRVNHPSTYAGLTQCRRWLRTPSFDVCPAVCSEHWKRRLFFCGVCLRDAPPQEMGEYQYQQIHPSIVVGVHENEDEETWPGVHATCRACRGEALWRRVKDSPADIASIGGPRLSGDLDWDFTGEVDWETGLSRDAFLTWADGTLDDLITLARDKYWLRKNTKIHDLLEQLLVSTAYEAAVTGRGSRRRATLTPELASNAEYDDSDISDEDGYGVEDEDGAHYREEAQVRPLALQDWARGRILEGHWLAPSDQMYIAYGHIESEYGAGGADEDFVVEARHPCPWLTEEGEPDPEDTTRGIPHPRLSSVHLGLPTSTNLLRALDSAWAQQMRAVLMPALKNLVRKLVQEYQADAPHTRVERAASVTSPHSSPVLPTRTLATNRPSTDPAVRAARLSLDDVMEQLREESSWIEGIDWVARREYRREDERREEASHREKADEEMNENEHADSPPTSSSTASRSLPPDSDVAMAGGEEEKVTGNRDTMDEDPTPITIAVDPVLENPRTMPAVPYIPVSIAHLPEKSRRVLWDVWREACSPLYHCRCRICVRAQAVASGADAMQATDPQRPTERQYEESQTVVTPLAPAMQIELEAMETMDGEDEMDDAELESYLSSAEEELEEVTMQEAEMEYEAPDGARLAQDRTTVVLDAVTHDRVAHEGVVQEGGDAPDRAGDADDDTTSSIDGEPVEADSPHSARKRSCDELEANEQLEALPRKVRRAASQQLHALVDEGRTNGHLDRTRSAEHLGRRKPSKTKHADGAREVVRGSEARSGPEVRSDGGRRLSYDQVQIRVPIYSGRGLQEKDLVEYAR